MKVTARAIMTVYCLHGDRKFRWMGHRRDGLPDPKHASMIGKTKKVYFDWLLEQLQARGVQPGTELKITIETIRPKRKMGKKK